MALLDVKNLTKRFGGLVANKDISLSVEAGEIVAIIGPNGAGKSTLFNGLVGHHEPTSGTVAFAGESMIGRRPEQVAAMGLVRTCLLYTSGRRPDCHDAPRAGRAGPTLSHAATRPLESYAFDPE